MDKEIIGEVNLENPKVYQYADFTFKCHSCGNEVTLIENVKGGLRYDLYATDQHRLKVTCNQCGNSLELFFKEAANPPIEDEETQDEEVQSETPEDIEVSGEEEALKTESGTELKEESEDEQVPEESKTEE